MKISSELKIINKKVSKLLLILFILSIILIPFDNLPYLKSVFGELSFKASIYPIIMIILILFVVLIKNKQLYFNKSKELYLLLIFIGWNILSIIVNLNSILENNFKDRSGISKLLLQIMVLGFGILIFYSSDIIVSLKKLTLYDFRKCVLFSIIPVAMYGTIELLHLSKIINFSWIIENVSYLIQTYHRGEVYTKGIRTVTGEASYFAMYIAFVFPWIISYIFTEKEKIKKYLYSILSLYILMLLIFSKSRTAYGILFIQIMIFTVFILTSKVSKLHKITVLKAIGICMILFVLVNSTTLSKIGGDRNSVPKISISSLVTSLTDTNNMSNVARFGMQSAAIKMGSNNILFGVGLGQYGFNINDYISKKALTSDEVKRWTNPTGNYEYWPPTFSLYSRIVAEQGGVGILLWMSFILYVLIKSIIVHRKTEDDILGISLIVSYIGLLLAWMNADSFVQIAFWMLLPFIIRYNNEKIGNESCDKIEVSLNKKL
ncbi:O-antigen ligase family protein [Clostridium sp.]|uniref:O-antigen ligase family protein n=1 Tax=Clostridium sp. TaxID=1506 RepID=UPI0039965A1C